MGLLGSLGIGKLAGFLKAKTLQGEIQALSALMRQARAEGLKKNLAVGMMFDAPAGNLRVFEDRNENGKWDIGESIRDFPLNREIRIGPSPNPPHEGPDGSAVPQSGLGGAWSGNLVFARDAMATPNVGAVYLHHARLEGWTASLSRSGASQQIQAFLWDGDSWTRI